MKKKMILITIIITFIIAPATVFAERVQELEDILLKNGTWYFEGDDFFQIMGFTKHIEREFFSYMQKENGDGPYNLFVFWMDGEYAIFDEDGLELILILLDDGPSVGRPILYYDEDHIKFKKNDNVYDMYPLSTVLMKPDFQLNEIE